MTTEPILEHIIVSTETSPLAKVKKSFNKHKTSLVLGAALAASMTLNVLLAKKPDHTCKYDLNTDDIEYLNRLLEEDRQK